MVEDAKKTDEVARAPETVKIEKNRIRQSALRLGEFSAKDRRWILNQLPPEWVELIRESLAELEEAKYTNPHIRSEMINETTGIGDEEAHCLQGAKAVAASEIDNSVENIPKSLQKENQISVQFNESGTEDKTGVWTQASVESQLMTVALRYPWATIQKVLDIRAPRVVAVLAGSMDEEVIRRYFKGVETERKNKINRYFCEGKHQCAGKVKALLNENFLMELDSLVKGDFGVFADE